MNIKYFVGASLRNSKFSASNIEVKKTKNYDAELIYFVYQVIDELKASEKDENNKIIYHYLKILRVIGYTGFPIIIRIIN